MPNEFEIEDFWPELAPALVVTPASILKTQATALSRKTIGLLQGEVRTWANEGNIYHQFVVVVPALENYRYSILRIHHGAPVYPVYVDEAPTVAAEEQFTGFIVGRYKSDVLPDDGNFRRWLREALASADTKRILESLLAQATV
jgi:hypothetical protein